MPSMKRRLYRDSNWRTWRGLILFGAMTCCVSAQGDAESERELLARLTHEIEALAPMIDAAEAQANPDDRVRFRYDWLREDLQRVRSGIQAHIDTPRSEPRNVPPLRGDYRQ